jgi:hypothetical protein
MMGERRSDQGALFYEFSLEAHVPEDHCQSARKIDPLSASKIDPACAVVAGPGRCNFSSEWNRPGSAGGSMLRRGS